VPCAALLLLSSLLLASQPLPLACADVAACKQAALDAAARRDFEAFHDLAWRAAQKGRPNDPELMYLLARAQSLSGRPGDALVMLRRLAELGIVTDARDNEEFTRVRALAGWEAVDELMANVPAKPKIEADALPSPAAAAAAPAPAAPTPNVPKAPVKPPARAEPAPAAPKEAPAPARTEPATPAPAIRGEAALALPDASLEPVGLAYDSASRRFVVGDRHANKLIVADDVFKRVNDLIGAASGGFGVITGVEIDTRRGDLWVSSNGDDGRSSLHKLQLVSGRVLSTVDVPADLLPTRFTDIVISDSGLLLLVDARGSRIVPMRNGAREFDPPIQLKAQHPTSVATTGDIAYVAHEDGLSAVNLKTGRVTKIQAARGVDLKRLQRVRATRDAIVALQSDSETESSHLVRIRLRNGGTVANTVEPMDEPFVSAGPALTISRQAVYYVARTPEGQVIRRVELR
jgi:hypothetical protein